jgi:hypothetical protein
VRQRRREAVEQHGHVVEDVGREAPELCLGLERRAQPVREEDRGQAPAGLLQRGEQDGRGCAGRGVAHADAGQHRPRREQRRDRAGEGLERVVELVREVVAGYRVRVPGRQEDGEGRAGERGEGGGLAGGLLEGVSVGTPVDVVIREW